MASGLDDELGWLASSEGPTPHHRGSYRVTTGTWALSLATAHSLPSLHDGFEALPVSDLRSMGHSLTPPHAPGWRAGMGSYGTVEGSASGED